MIKAEQLELDRESISEEQNRQISFDFELKQLLLYGPTLGIYILPRLDQPYIWNGLIFVRHGCYKDGRFKFNMNMKDFPQKAPEIIFQAKLFHPLVDLNTGNLDVNSIIVGNWNQKNPAMLYNFMNSLHGIFTSSEQLVKKRSFNEEAACLFLENQREFMLRALKSVNYSLDCFEKTSMGSSFRFQAIAESEKDDLLSLLRGVCYGEGSVQDKIQAFISRVLQ